MAFALENRNIPAQDIFERINYYTDLLEMQDLLDRDIFTLSGGEKQRLLLAMAKAANKLIIVLDEPTKAAYVTDK